MHPTDDLLRAGWLKRQAEQARREVEEWPEWMRTHLGVTGHNDASRAEGERRRVHDYCWACGTEFTRDAEHSCDVPASEAFWR